MTSAWAAWETGLATMADVSAIELDARELADLVDRREAIERRIRAISERLQHAVRPEWHCERCGYDWLGHRGRVPRWCARCHSSAWRDKSVVAYPGSKQRMPGDPPNPNWRERQGRLPVKRPRRRKNIYLPPITTIVPDDLLPVPAALILGASTLPPPPEAAWPPTGFIEVKPGVLRREEPPQVEEYISAVASGEYDPNADNDPGPEEEPPDAATPADAE